HRSHVFFVVMNHFKHRNTESTNNVISVYDGLCHKVFTEDCQHDFGKFLKHIFYQDARNHGFSISKCEDVFYPIRPAIFTVVNSETGGIKINEELISQLYKIRAQNPESEWSHMSWENMWGGCSC